MVVAPGLHLSAHWFLLDFPGSHCLWLPGQYCIPCTVGCTSCKAGFVLPGPLVVMCQAGLGSNTRARARLLGARAHPNLEPGPQEGLRLGPARLRLGPGLLTHGEDLVGFGEKKTYNTCISITSMFEGSRIAWKQGKNMVETMLEHPSRLRRCTCHIWKL